MVVIPNNQPLSSTRMIVTSLSRYAIKGLPGDSLSSVTFHEPLETFPDDRRFAFLKRSSKQFDNFDACNPKWLHKENFACAFSDPEFMARFDSEYEILPPLKSTLNEEVQEQDQDRDQMRRILTIWNRDNGETFLTRSTSSLALGPVDLSTGQGRIEASQWISKEYGETLHLVTAQQTQSNNRKSGLLSKKHVHQFGNTQSGVRARNDTRTLHIINAATVRELSERWDVPLRPSRFRPNIVVDGLQPWAEFDFVGQSLQVRPPSADESEPLLKLDVITKTIRCDGIGVDPLDLPRERQRMDIPKLLAKNYPEYGPYFGVYATVACAGSLTVGDELQLLTDT